MSSNFSFRNAGVYYALLLIIIVLSLISAASGRSTYLSLENAANVLDQTAWVAILAVAMTIVLISGNFDLSVGSVAAFSGAVAITTVDHIGPFGAITLSLLSGAGFGLINGFLVVRFRINAFIVTLGTMTAIRGLLFILTNSRTVVAETASQTLSPLQDGNWYINSTSMIFAGLFISGTGIWLAWRRDKGKQVGTFAAIAAGVALFLGGLMFDVSWELTLPVLYMIVIAAAAWFVLNRTLIGRRLFAAGGNREAAHLAGIAVDRYKIVPFAVTGLAAAMIGVLYAGEIRSINPGTFQGLELDVLAAAILGGTSLFGGAGSVIKSVAGALILTTLANGFNILNLGARYQSLVVGVVIIAAAAIYTAHRGRPRAPSRSQAGERTLAAQRTAVPQEAKN